MAIFRSIGHGLVSLIRDFVTACWEVVKLPFYLIAVGWRRFFGLGARKVILLVIAAVVVTVVASSTFVEATSQPEFCITCHVMQPYFDAWRASTHNKVSCVICHVPPGVEGTIKHKFMAFSMLANYVTGLYKRSKPWAEIDDASCLREGCHQTRLLKGKENFKGVIFDHEPHLLNVRRDRQLRCTSCHAQIVQGEHISVTEGTCFLCHFRPDRNGQPTPLAQCTHCHRPPTGPAAADTAFDHTSVLKRGVDCLSCHATAVSGDGYVPPERCSSCHAKVEHIQRYGDLEFVHLKHVTEHKVECLQCHIAIRHGRGVALEKDPSRQCAACHGGADDAIEMVWNGRLPGLPVAPSVMAKAGMTCLSCHVEPIHQDGHYRKPACTPCHDEHYDRLWPQWKAPLMRTVVMLEQEAARLNGALRDSIRKALAIYQAGDPVHNPGLATVFQETIGGTRGASGENCANCHPAAAAAVPLWHGKPVPHDAHAAARVACVTCHETSQDQHGRVKLSVDECNQCHHREAAKTGCESCHPYQTAVYRGRLMELGGFEPSPMAAADVACSDCHTLADGNIQRHDESACAACHDPGYADTLHRWAAAGDSLLAVSERRIKGLARTAEEYERYQQYAAALRRDGSRSVHNPRLFVDWMKRTEVTP
jgi:nitrate/TMAO reductase-like tetraheme cytochrome c subunit